MQTYYGGRSETRIRCTEVPVVPVDFTSEYPTCCALLDLFEILTAESITFEDDTNNIRKFVEESLLTAASNLQYGVTLGSLHLSSRTTIFFPCVPFMTV